MHHKNARKFEITIKVLRRKGSRGQDACIHLLKGKEKTETNKILTFNSFSASSLKNMQPE